MPKLDLAELFAEMDAAEKVEKDAISRRNVLLGLATVAAPFVIRTPGILMPVRYRPQMYNEYGFRNWPDFPPSLEEVKNWRAGINHMLDQGIHVLWSAEGFNEIAPMGDAEKRFEAIGLL